MMEGEPMIDNVQRDTEPFDRLTLIANEMVKDLPDDVKAVVLLTDDVMNGSCLAGWDSDTDATAHIFMTLRAVMKANGVEMSMMTEDGVII